MNRTIRNTMIAVATAMIFTAPLAASPAEAGGKPKVHFGVYVGGPGYAAPYAYSGYRYANPCRWLKRRWFATGNPKWRWRYERCMWRTY
ncbi:MAG: hypothetical protein RLZ98_2140 [Pseudomonadota bacterium]|jgi:hypothetical protein